MAEAKSTTKTTNPVKQTINQKHETAIQFLGNGYKFYKEQYSTYMKGRHNTPTSLQSTLGDPKHGKYINSWCRALPFRQLNTRL